jgi:hypothetical protein
MFSRTQRALADATLETAARDVAAVRSVDYLELW